MAPPRTRRRPVSTRRATADAVDPPLPRAEVLEQLPVMALVGRPNTGKSTLFNRLTGSRRALVAAVPGVTRDRNFAVARHGERRFLVVDTGGFEDIDGAELSGAVRAQALVAADQADVVVAVLDGRAGLNPLDAMLIDRLRPLKQPVLVAVNKIDTPRQVPLVEDFYGLGVEPLFAISAEHGLGVGELVDAALGWLPAPVEPPPEEAEPPISVAIIGRPNVGKSSLLNRLVGFERAIVSAQPGTTRDALDTPVLHGGRAFVLVDTAGVRRRPRVQQHLERASVVRALRALERAEIALLVIDAVEGITEQDARIASYAWERGRGLIVVVNKWDAVPPEAEAKKVGEEIDYRFPSLAVVPKLFISARTGRGADRIWPAIERVGAAHRARMPTAKVNAVISSAVRMQAPPMVSGVRPKLFYGTQTATAPPTVTVFCNAPERIAPAYERFVLNQLRAAFPLEGTPLRLRFQSRPRRPARPQNDSRKRPTKRRRHQR